MQLCLKINTLTTSKDCFPHFLSYCTAFPNIKRMPECWCCIYHCRVFELITSLLFNEKCTHACTNHSLYSLNDSSRFVGGGGSIQINWCTHAWTKKKCKKRSFFTVWHKKHILHLGIWKYWPFQEKGLFFFKIRQVSGGQIWCETAQNPCLWVFSWRALNLLGGYFWHLCLRMSTPIYQSGPPPGICLPR